MKPKWFDTLLLSSLLLIGLYYPTSLNTVISPELTFIASGVLAVLFAAMILRYGLTERVAVANALFLSASIVVFTPFSPLDEFAYGAILPIVLITMMYCLSLRQIELSGFVINLLTLLNVAHVAISILVIMHNPVIFQVIRDNYSAAYPELLPNMLNSGKPVLMFHSHSVAAFYFYVFFYMSFRAFVSRRSLTALVCALSYLTLEFALNSFTGYVSILIASAQILFYFERRYPIRSNVIALALFILGASHVLRQFSVQELAGQVQDVFDSDNSGLRGRYSEHGGLRANIEYISEHPFRPIGLGYSNQLFYGDSGPITFWIRGSAPMFVSAYLGLWLFLRNNLRSKRQAIFLFFLFFGFEIGYGNLEYLRTEYLLPFLVVYLNTIEKPQAASVRVAERSRGWTQSLVASH
jgi:hypothetical protein